MKKICSVLLVLAILATMCVTVFAAPGGFVESPTGQETPVLIEGHNESEDCGAGVLITPYTLRERLGDYSEDQIEAAYRSIAEATDLFELMPLLHDLEGEAFAISDLFDISYGYCQDHNNHGANYLVKISSEALPRFAALVHWDGKIWSLIEECFIDEEGYLHITTEKSGPFAIVVTADAPAVNEPVEEECCLWIYIAIIVACLLLLIIFFIVMKKKKKKS